MDTHNKPVYEDRYLGGTPHHIQLARQLYQQVANLPLICPHGHVAPEVFADPDYTFGTPVDLFIIPDHYVFRMLYSQGIPLDALGIPRRDGVPVEGDHRKIWQLFADHFYLFHGTPSGVWIRDELRAVFGVEEKLTGESAPRIYDRVAERLTDPAYRPRALFERFNIEVLATTDAATSPLTQHQAIRDSGWAGRVLPTFRPDALFTLDAPGWPDELQALADASGTHIASYPAFIDAIQNRRAFFKSMGATATDHGVPSAATEPLADLEAEALFQRALSGGLRADDTPRFISHMLVMMAQMSVDDGLVMQIHPGSFRNHNPYLLEHFGRDMGMDIPVQMEYTRSLKPLLDRLGNDPRLTLILFTLDETTYGRELAPLAGVYPALRLGPPWWFFDSLNGIQRYFDSVIETAGIYNTVGFNDDTRAFMSIPARHDLWRRASASWLAGLVLKQVVDLDDAEAMIAELAYGLAKRTYQLDDGDKQP
ncbi:MAG: glucuronate isomerase [Anaerolineaceae bacterium]|nr:glucuronate isomerase [Anaerolineaceae bacterium]